LIKSGDYDELISLQLLVLDSQQKDLP